MFKSYTITTKSLHLPFNAAMRDLMSHQSGKTHTIMKELDMLMNTNHGLLLSAIGIIKTKIKQT